MVLSQGQQSGETRGQPEGETGLLLLNPGRYRLENLGFWVSQQALSNGTPPVPLGPALLWVNFFPPIPTVKFKSNKKGGKVVVWHI